MKTEMKIVGFTENEFQVDDAGRVHSAEGVSDTAPIKTAGTLTFPLAHETARSIITYIAQEVAARGEQLPNPFKFRAGELLLTDEGEVEEARMIWETLNEQGETRLWKQEEGDAPTFVEYKDGQFWTDGEKKEEIERRHLSAVVAPDEQGTPSLHLRFDLRDNAQIIAPKGTQLEREVHYPRVIKVPNGAADRDLGRAMAMHPEWPQNLNAITRYQEGREGTTVVFQPPEVLETLQSAPEKAMKALDERFIKMKSDLTADLIDILFHHWMHNKIEARGKRAGITLARICQYRGVEPRGENLENVWHAMRNVRSIRLQNGGVDAALFEMDSIDFTSPVLPDKDTLYFYQPGYFVQFGLEGNRLYYAPFLESIWKLNPHQNAEAKRLARFLRGEWRLNPDTYTDPTTGAKRWRSWRDLLAEMGIFPDQWKAQGRNITRELRSIEGALQTLYEKEFLAVEGKDIYHPDDRARLDNLQRKPKGRLEAWLELRVCLLPAADIADALAEGRAQREAQQQQNAQAIAKAKARNKLRAKK